MRNFCRKSLGVLFCLGFSTCAAAAAAETNKDLQPSSKDLEPYEVDSAGPVVPHVPPSDYNSGFFVPSMVLHHRGVMVMLEAAVRRAEEMGVPQVIVIVDASGEVLGEVKMSGSKFLSRKSAFAKARTAASINNASHRLSEAVAAKLASASQGAMTSLMGGLPIRVGGMLAGGIGVGSGHGDQDLEVAHAALAAAGADYFE